MSVKLFLPILLYIFFFFISLYDCEAFYLDIVLSFFFRDCKVFLFFSSLDVVLSLSFLFRRRVIRRLFRWHFAVRKQRRKYPTASWEVTRWLGLAGREERVKEVGRRMHEKHEYLHRICVLKGFSICDPYLNSAKGKSMLKCAVS